MQVNTVSKLDNEALVLGLNPSVSNQVYHSDRTYKSSSVIKKMYTDIAEYYREYELGQKENKESAALDEGSLTHTLILEPHLFKSEFVVAPFFDKKQTGYKAWKEARSADGRTIISESQLNKVQQWVKSFKAHPHASKYVQGGVPEQTITCLWNVDTGAISFNEADEGPRTVRIKVRFDYINAAEGYINDIKTTKDPAGPEIFANTAFTEVGKFVFMYDLSAALYLAVAEAWYKRDFYFLFTVLSKADVACDVYKLSAKRRAEGLAKINKALKKYLAAKESGVWKETALITPSSDIVEI